MGKNLLELKNKDRDGEAKVLFKKSNAALFINSRTVSGASQSFSRSGILQIKKNFENYHNYYEYRGKLKRDLSVETDVCILRRYYRSKKKKLSTRDGSAKSKFSTVIDTEVDTIGEFPDTSACGDNDTDIKSNSPLDVATLMIDNLKDLLNQWIQEHLLENKDNKQKIDSVIHSLIEKMDKKALTSSSGSTYVLHKETTTNEVKDKKVPTPSFTCVNVRSVKVGTSGNVRRIQSSTFTIPFKCKDIRIISTLSIPRTFHKKGIEEQKPHSGSWYKMKKVRHKDIILSLYKSNKVVESSSFDLVAISRKSFAKKITDNDDEQVKKKKRHIILFPKPFYKSTTENSSVTNNEIRINNVDTNKKHLSGMSSLMECLYATNIELATDLDKNIQNNIKDTITKSKSNEIIVNTVAAEKLNDTCIQQSTEDDQCDPIVGINYVKDQQIEFNVKRSKSLNISKQRTTKKHFKKTLTRGKFYKHRRRVTNKIQRNVKVAEYKNIQNKTFTFLYKKTNPMYQEKAFSKYCQNIFEYFEDYDTNKNIKLDIHINLFPTCENRTKDVYTDISNQALGIYDIKGGPTLLYNVEPTQISTSENMDEDSTKDHTENDSSYGFTPEIIPLLDGAVSQSKYIFEDNSRNNLENNSKANSPMERSTLTSEIDIIQEISELRAIIKDLAAAAEKFVNQQNKSTSAGTYISSQFSNRLTSSSHVHAVISLRNPSKAIQHSKELTEKQKLLSGFKLSKEPKKKDTFEYYNRLTKKSTSYRIIDSESILRVTDMTSKANETFQNKANEENLTRFSLNKSRSLFELTGDQRNRQKFITLFCNGYAKNLRCNVCRVHKRPSQCSNTLCIKSSRRRNKNWFARKKKTDIKNVRDKPRPHPIQQHLYDDAELSSEPPILLAMPSCICPPENECDDPDCVPTLIPEGTSFRYSTTKVYHARKESEEIEIEDEQTATIDDGGQKKIRKIRKGMSFAEGCMYCMLLWIPVIIIACLFYGYVLKDKGYVEEKTSSTPPPILVPIRNNTSVLYVKLRDLGF